MTLRLVLNIIFVAAGLYTLWSSASHFADEGCEGGVCAALLLFYSLPLLLSWLFTIAAANFALSDRKIFMLFLVPAILFNLIILVPNYHGNSPYLDLPAWILVGSHGFILLIYIFQKVFRKKVVRTPDN